MIEKEIESNVIEIIDSELSAISVDHQIIGAWQTTTEGLPKGNEKVVDCIVTVKIYPRQYETFTIPQADIQCDVALAMRIENDNTGTKYVEATEKIQNKIHQWQKSFQLMYNDISVSGFEPTGFRIDGGDCGLDKSSQIWQFSQSFTVQGVILT